MKKVVFIFSMIVIFIVSPPFLTTAANTIQIFLNGMLKEFDQPPILKNNRTYLPIRHIAEATGSKVDWIKESSTVQIKKDNTMISFQIGQTVAEVNGEKKEIPESFITNNRTMVPLRFISEQLGLEVEWDGEKRVVYISQPSIKETQLEEQPKVAKMISVQLSNEEKQKAQKLLTDRDRVERIERIIEKGTIFLGTPYQYGAEVGDLTAFDCSSFVAYLFKEEGIIMPRSASDQMQMGMKIPKEEIQRGDLLFFDTELNGNIEHVGIYLGNNEMLHVSTSKGVQITSLFDYWHDRYVVATRN